MELYYAIVNKIRSHRGLSKDIYASLCKEFPEVQDGALYSMISLEYQNRMKVNHVKTPNVINKYYDLYTDAIDKREPPGIIVRMAKELDICPCLIAKLILQKHFSLFAIDQKSGLQMNINQYLRDTTLIEDSDLAYEVYLCTLYDDVYSPISDTLKNSLGQQYEIKLYRELTELGLAFRDEEYLRKFGYDKTPDIKLEVPVAIDGAIVHWIESKALFGDEEVHKDYTKNQYASYWNRFGTGLVIYWFGFVDTIEQFGDKRFIIRDCMPQNILHIIPPKENCEEEHGNIKYEKVDMSVDSDQGELQEFSVNI